MKRILTAAVTAVAASAIVFAAAASAQAPPPVPNWPPGKAQVFVWADTVTSAGAQANFFAPGQSVTFRSYAIDMKTTKVLTSKDVQFYYVSIPNQPPVKMTYGPQGAKKTMLWTGTWTIPADYPLGVVQFRILVKTHSKRIGTFAQAPVAASQLTVTTTP